MNKIKVAVIGAAGRMGKTHVRQVLQDSQLQLSGATEMPNSPFIGQDVAVLAGLEPCSITVSDNLESLLDNTQVIIDFSSATSTMQNVKKAVAANVAMVIGTTGLTDENKAELKQLAEQGGRIVQAPNMSVGVNLLFALCNKVAKLLGDDYDIEVVEMHHNRKKDAPSGTAERLGQILAEATGRDYNKDTRHGRVGMVGERTKQEIGMHALRGGDVVGDHTVIFATDGERIELTHKASSRETFSKGSARAVKFIVNAKSGLYNMQDVLGLKA